MLPREDIPRQGLNHKIVISSLFCLLAGSCGLTGVSLADGNINNGPTTNNTTEHNTMSATDTGVAVNGNVTDSNVNSNQNTLTTGNNYNSNQIRPVIYTPTMTSGGHSALVMPRNPLPLPNANLGRSNFGLQFGVQNNPSLTGFNGNNNALGWFMQGGVTIPFGRIPDVLANPHNTKLDQIRQDGIASRRNVFGNIEPGRQVETKVQGKVMGLSAYNFTTLPASKLQLPNSSMDTGIGEIKMHQPKLLALVPAEVYSKPINTGEKVGVISAGTEYPYLGHTRSGWVKILLPNGVEGWASTHFEYIKNDFTEVDTLAVDPNVGKTQKAAAPERTLKR